MQKLYIPGFAVYRNDRPDSTGGGVAIAVRNSIRHKAISTPTPSLETSGVELSLNEKPLRIITCYSPPQTNNICEIPLLMNSDIPTILAGDFNAKHDSWGCRAKNAKGTVMLQLLYRHDFSIEAPSEFTYFPTDPNKIPDILDIFITKNVTLTKDPWSPTLLNSDHTPVFLEVPCSFSPVTPTRPKIDWLSLRYHLENSSYKCSTPKTTAEIDEALTAFTEEIQAKIDLSSTSVPVSQRRTPLPPEIRAQIKEKNLIRRSLQRSHDPSLRRKLNKAQRDLDTALQEIRDSSFVKYISEAEENSKSCWKVIKSLRNRQPYSPPLTKDGKSYSADEDKANIVAESLKDQCSPFPTQEKFAEFHQHVTETVRLFRTTNHDFEHTSPGEVANTIKNLKNNKAPGYDRIPNKVLKTLPKKHTVAFCNIINAMMRLQYFPKAWKEATIICLPKQGKPLNQASSYRPISLLSTLSKVAESIILRRLNKFVKESNILPNFQHGFRHHHSTSHQLLRVAEHIAVNLNMSRHTSMLLLDAKQAFDRVWHDGLIFKLIILNCPHYLIGLVQSFLSNRTFRVRIGKSLSNPQPITAGVPQGSKLSPTLFNIFSYDIPTSNKIMIAQYADDTALLYTAKQISFCSSVMNKFIPTLLDWYHKWGFNLNETKSEAVFFSKREEHPPKLIVNNHRIPWSDSAKYLGVIFDRKLSWRKQAKAVRDKTNAAFQSLKPFFNNSKISKRTKIRSFNAIIHSICTYGITIWVATSPPNFKLVQGTYMRTMRGALNYPWYVRNKQILKETGLPSLQETAQKYAQNLREKITEHDNPSIRSLANFSSKDRDRYRRPCSLLPIPPRLH